MDRSERSPEGGSVAAVLAPGRPPAVVRAVVRAPSARVARLSASVGPGSGLGFGVAAVGGQEPVLSGLSPGDSWTIRSAGVRAIASGSVMGALPPVAKPGADASRRPGTFPYADPTIRLLARSSSPPVIPIPFPHPTHGFRHGVGYNKIRWRETTPSEHGSHRLPLCWRTLPASLFTEGRSTAVWLRVRRLRGQGI